MTVSRGCKVQIQLSRAETSEWVDPEARAEMVASFAARARAKGRRYVQICDSTGRELLMTESGLP